MNIASIFERKKPVLSFEIFPPKKGGDLGSIYETLSCLKDLAPDFISVTFGAGGNLAGSSTCDVARMIKRQFGIEPLVHLTCQGASKADIRQILDNLTLHGLTNILALRGDRNPDDPRAGEFSYTNELIDFIQSQGDFHISAACYPEGHPDSPTLDDDIRHLKGKVDAGASHLVSQLFFDNTAFYSFLEKAELAGVDVPIEAGIMPVVNKKQIERMISLCGASFPAKFRRIIEKYEHHPEALRDAGIAYAIDQMVDLLAHEVDGIHLYTMNNPDIAKRICRSIGSLIRV